MDIPDRQENGICDDALYVSDSGNIYKLMVRNNNASFLFNNGLLNNIQ